MGFADDVRASLIRINARQSEKLQQDIQDLFVKVVDYSPSQLIGSKFAHGVLKNQWYPQINGVSSVSGQDADQNGSASLQRIVSTCAEIPKNGDFSISLANNLPYSYRAEALGWGFTPAYGMISRAVVDFGANK